MQWLGRGKDTHWRGATRPQGPPGGCSWAGSAGTAERKHSTTCEERGTETSTPRVYSTIQEGGREWPTVLYCTRRRQGVSYSKAVGGSGTCTAGKQAGGEWFVRLGQAGAHSFVGQVGADPRDCIEDGQDGWRGGREAQGAQLHVPGEMQPRLGLPRHRELHQRRTRTTDIANSTRVMLLYSRTRAAHASKKTTA